MTTNNVCENCGGRGYNIVASSSAFMTGPRPPPSDASGDEHAAYIDARRAWEDSFKRPCERCTTHPTGDGR